MRKTPIVLRLLCLGVIQFGSRFVNTGSFAGQIALLLTLIAIYYILLVAGSGRSYMKTLHGRLETLGAGLMLAGISVMMIMVIISGSPDIGVFAVFPGGLYFIGLIASSLGALASTLLPHDIAKQKEPIQLPETTRGK